jgi:hypothetical protein
MGFSAHVFKNYGTRWPERAAPHWERPLAQSHQDSPAAEISAIPPNNRWKHFQQSFGQYFDIKLETQGQVQVQLIGIGLWAELALTTSIFQFKTNPSILVGLFTDSFPHFQAVHPSCFSYWSEARGIFEGPLCSMEELLQSIECIKLIMACKSGFLQQCENGIWTSQWTLNNRPYNDKQVFNKYKLLTISRFSLAVKVVTNGYKQ